MCSRAFPESGGSSPRPFDLASVRGGACVGGCRQQTASSSLRALGVSVVLKPSRREDSREQERSPVLRGARCSARRPRPASTTRHRGRWEHARRRRQAHPATQRRRRAAGNGAAGIDSGDAAGALRGTVLDAEVAEVQGDGNEQHDEDGRKTCTALIEPSPEQLLRTCRDHAFACAPRKGTPDCRGRQGNRSWRHAMPLDNPAGAVYPPDRSVYITRSIAKADSMAPCRSEAKNL
jgi:hypothetical protein